MLAKLLLATAGVCLFLTTPCAASPCSSGAPVDTADRCRFIVKFAPDDVVSDSRVIKRLHLRSGQSARSIAFIVGIGKYKNPDFDVSSAAVDVANLQKFFIDDQKFDEVIVLTDQDASAQNIQYFFKKYLRERAQYYSGRTRLVFAFSGHGVQIANIGFEPDSDSHLPSVALPMYSATDSDDYANMYGLDELLALFHEAAKNNYHFVALINACYGGDIFAGGLSDGGSNSATDQAGAWALTAGPDNQETFSAGSGRGSIFFEAVINGVMTGGADRDAQAASAHARDTDPALEGIVRFGPLSEYITTWAHLHSPGSGSDADNWKNDPHAWSGSVDPLGVHARGAFFFLQPVAQASSSAPWSDKATQDFEPAKVTLKTFAPSQNQTLSSVPAQFKDGYDDLRRAAPTVLGIDVSHHNGHIDWTKVAKAGVKFAYIKATEGSSFVDSKFAENWDAAARAGIARGAYHYVSFCASAEDQMKNIKEVIGQAKNALPMALDIELYKGQELATIPSVQKEGACAAKLGAAGQRDLIVNLANAIKSLTNQAPTIFARDYVYSDLLKDAPIEFAEWRSKLGVLDGPPQQQWSVWQYSINAHIDGVPTVVDLDVVSNKQRNGG